MQQGMEAGKNMNKEEIKKKIAEESARAGTALTEDELNAKVIEFSEMDLDALERVSGGHCSTLYGNCDSTFWCWSNDLCYVSERDPV